MTEKSGAFLYIANTITWGDLAIIVLLFVAIVCLFAIVSNTAKIASKSEKEKSIEK